MEIFNKTFLKFSLGFIAIIAVVVTALYFDDIKSMKAEYDAKAYLEELERQEMEDIYGGATPEETLQLFIDALKAGDVELASKYFVMEKQAEWLDNLKKIQDADKLNFMVIDILSAERGNDNLSDTAKFIAVNSNQEVVAIINVKINKFSNLWKIESL